MTGEGQVRLLTSATGPSRRAMLSGWVGFFVDMVDIYLPVIALAPAIAYFQPASLSATEASLLFYVTFAATLLGRPVGAVVFGHFSDTVGRRRVTLVSIAGFSVCTLLIGLLPGYAAAGAAAPAALVALRFVDGVFLGGEYTAATPLAFEHCPPGARGLFGGLLMGAYAAAYAVVSAVVLVLLATVNADQYQAWGWRLPFLAGGLAGFVFLGYRSRVPESQLWRSVAKETQPLRVVLTGRARADFVQVLTLMVGLWLVATSVVSVLPRLLLTHLGRSPNWTTGVLLVAQVLVFAGFVTAGTLSQRWGRRPVLIGGGVLSSTLGLACYLLLLTISDPAPALVAVLVVLTELVVLAVWGVVTSYAAERFDTSVRSSGFGVAYSLGVVPASFYAAYLAGLSHLMPFHLTQLVLLAVGGVVTVSAAWWGPETRQTTLDRPGREAPC